MIISEEEGTINNLSDSLPCGLAYLIRHGSNSDSNDLISIPEDESNEDEIVFTSSMAYQKQSPLSKRGESQKRYCTDEVHKVYKQQGYWHDNSVVIVASSTASINLVCLVKGYFQKRKKVQQSHISSKSVMHLWEMWTDLMKILTETAGQLHKEHEKKPPELLEFHRRVIIRRIEASRRNQGKKEGLKNSILIQVMME
ncbi:hypothetical protein NPIL_203131 [Nephila pilipes]|uniref:Uncharacterized protein n=1 Tax=Nephila pilipes TaxID=299642 RepID=A0A8X6Q7D7_NEPPI|nr:hypothetical protein NPIL_203131 [Nephila pilipes]